MIEKKEILHSYYMIRKIIGLLGVLLPVLVVVFYGDFLSSISHYYYTKSSVFFISILFAFGILLISYKGYERDKKNEILSDNVITHIGGIAVLIVVFFPTSCLDSNSLEIFNMCSSKDYPLFGHSNTIINAIHLISAGIFLFIMGWMSIYRFTKGSDKSKNKMYKFFGYVVWISIGVLLIEFVIEQFNSDFKITNYDVFILETISVFSFGISWLIKGEAIKDLIVLKNKCFKTVIKKESN
ncbi:MAG: hypothetical protein KAJ28_07895 [Flavobacteriaceae bacterium]|nr:hypothetical protein [Flavobacteriaceae bacterium]